MPTKSVTTMLYELWTIRKLDLSFLQPWGCVAYVYNSSHKYGKLGLRVKKSIFIRYNEESKGYIFIGEQESGSVTKFGSQDVTFLEKDFPKLRKIGENLLLYETDDQITSTPCKLDPFNSSGSDSRQNELVSNVPQSSPEMDPNLVSGPSKSNIRINESPLR